jgi:hypothetical protein
MFGSSRISLNSSMKHKKSNHALAQSARAVLRPISHRVAAISRYLNSHETVRLGLGISLLFSLFWVVCFQRLDPDFGWHLRTGQYITLTHHVPLHDLYTYTARSFRWIDHEWGNDVIMAWLYARGGYAVVATLFAGLWTASLILAARKARFHVLLIGALAIMPYVGTRPLAWTVLFFAILLTTLRSTRPNIRYWLPLLFIMWANIHAGFIAGLAVIAYFAFVERRRSTFYILLACFAATLCNAYGLRIYDEVFRTILDPALHSQINEWHAFALNSVSWFMVALWLTGVLAVSKWRRLFSLSGLLFLTSLSASRNFPLFAVSALPELNNSFNKIMAAIPRKLERQQRIVKVTLLSAIVITTYCIALVVVLDAVAAPRESGYPKAAAAYLEQHPCRGNLFNGYGSGGYLIWKVPKQPVYIDGRMPTWQPYMKNYELLVHNPERYYRQDFARHTIHCALLYDAPGSHDFTAVLQRADWHVVYRSGGWVVLTDRE